MLVDVTDREFQHSAYERVGAGAEFLDAATPEWYTLVNIFTLDMGSCTDCIGGQVYGEFYNLFDELGIVYGSAAYFGFDTFELVDFDMIKKESFYLNEAWIWERSLRIEAEEKGGLE